MTWKRVLSGLLILVLIVGGVWYYRKTKAAKADDELPEIETASVERKDLTITVSASGTLEALTTVEVKSRSGGEVTGMYVEAGDYVEAGQLIAQVDPTQIRTRADQASADVVAARASTSQARLNAQLQEVQTATTLTQAQASLEVARGDVNQSEHELAKERQTNADNIKKAKASLTSAKASRTQATIQRDAQKKLYPAELQSAQASLESSRQNLAKVKAGPRIEEIQQGRASLDSAKASLANAKTSLKRRQALLDKGFVSDQDLDDARRAYDQATADHTRSTAALAQLEAGNRAEDIAQAQAQLTQAQASLQLAEVKHIEIDIREQSVTVAEANVIQAEAQLASTEAEARNVRIMEQRLASAKAGLRKADAVLTQAETGSLQDDVKRHQIAIALIDLKKRTLALQDAAYDLQYTQIVAPRAGVVMSKLVEEGTVVPAGTAALREGTGLVTIADISEMYVLADVDEVDIAPVNEGQRAEVSISSLPDISLKGQVVKIFPLGVEDQNVVRFQVKVHIQTPPISLRPGMTADVTITVAERSNVLVVPDLCITRAQDETTVEVISEETLEKREVKVGLSNWEETEILEGVKEGEELLIPPPPGTELPRWMGGGDRTQAAQRNRSRMMRQLRSRGR